MKKRLRFFEKDTIDWRGPSLADFYRSVFDLKHAQPALANGPWGGRQTKLATAGGKAVYAFSRTRDTNTVVVAVKNPERNLGKSPEKSPGERIRVRVEIRPAKNVSARGQHLLAPRATAAHTK